MQEIYKNCIKFRRKAKKTLLECKFTINSKFPSLENFFCPV